MEHESYLGKTNDQVILRDRNIFIKKNKVLSLALINLQPDDNS